MVGLVISGSAQAQTYGTPSRYEVSVQQLELCEDLACSKTHIAASTTKAFDIASANAGAEVGAYASLSGLVAGTEIVAVKVTLSRTININGTASDPGGIGSGCATSTTNDGGAAGAFASLADGSETNGAGTAQDLVAPNPTGTNLGNITSAYTSANITITNGVAGMTIIYPLTTPYVCTGVEPRAEVKFNVSNALGAVNDGANACEMFPAPPSVTITLSTP